MSVLPNDTAPPCALECALGTWFADAGEPTGVYVDGWLQYGRYDHRVMGDYLRDETYDASTWAASWFSLVA